MAKSPLDLVKDVKYSDFDPFLYDYDEDEMDVNYDKPETHFASEYEPGYKDMEDGMFDNLIFFPTKKKGIFYLDSDQWGSGFTTPENMARYVKENYPYNRQQWEREMRGK